MHENNFGEKFENREIIEKAYEKSKDVIRKSALQEDSFVDLYGEDNVNNDKNYIAKMERVFEQDASEDQKYFKMRADVFEAILFEQAEMNEWLGKNVSTIKTTRYDDIKNGVDSIAEFQEEDRASHLALAIDATTSGDLNKKIERIKKEIEKGEMARIKYFFSEHVSKHQGFGRGEKVNIPRVVIGADRNVIKELSELWLENNNKELANHPIQFQILEEIIIQCGVFKNYAAKIQDGKDRTKIVNMYNKTQEIVKEIYDEKIKTIGDESFRRDDVFEAIKEHMKYF